MQHAHAKNNVFFILQSFFSRRNNRNLITFMSIVNFDDFSLYSCIIIHMKKLILITLLTIAATPVAMAQNPMFGMDTRNAVTLYAAQGTGPGSLFKLINPGIWDFSPQTFFMLQYSQPMEIFRLPGRMNFNAIQNFGYKGSRGLSFLGVGVSWDIALLQWNGFYFGGGIGPYMRDSRDRYVSSRLVFGEKVFIGRRINECWHAEIFTIHFSNGDFTETNRGFNFAGLALGYSF